MATYYVSPAGNDNGPGSTGSPWKTLGKAAAAVKAGDTVRVRAGTYNEVLNIKTKNVTFVADDPNDRPVIDGGYHPGLMSTNALAMNTKLPSAKTGYLGLGGNKALVTLGAEGVTVDGFIVQNAAGKGIASGFSNTTIRNCVTYWTFDTGIQSNPSKKISGLTIENNIVLYASVMIFEPTRRDYTSCKKDGQCVNGAIKFGNNNGNTVIRNNIVGYGFGEGINCGKGNEATPEAPILIEGNTVFDTNHTHIYVNAATNVIIRNNIVYCGGASVNVWGNGAPAGIRIKDENLKGGKYKPSDNIWIYNNLVVGMGMPIAVGERETNLSRFYVGYNTIVGGPEGEAKSNAAITVKRGEKGGGNQQGVVENNLVDYSMMSSGVLAVNNDFDAAGVAFRNNAWSSQPTNAKARSAGDVTGALRLVNARAALVTKDYMTKAQNTYALFKTSNNFNADNYRLTKESAAVGAASDRTRFNNVTPPSFTTDLSGAARGDLNRSNNQYWDIGALEYGGAVPPGDDAAVTASFTAVPKAGEAPLTVTFTDTSQASGIATINRRDWDLGDGTYMSTSLTSFQHTYPNPGQYKPKLTVRDATLGVSSSMILAEAINVTSPPVGEGLGIFDVVRAKLPASAGQMNLTFDLNGHAPELLIFLMSRATVANVLLTDANLSVGFATPGGQVCHVFEGKDAADPTNTHKYTTRGAAAVRMEGGVVLGKVSVASYGANRVTLDVTSGMSGILLTVIALGGPQYRATVGDFLLGADGQTTQLPIETVPEIYLFGGGNVAELESVENTADFSFGMADPDTQIGFSWRDVDGADTTRIKASVSTDAAVRTPFNKAWGKLTGYAHGIVQVEGGLDIGRRMIYAALDLAGEPTAVVKQFASPTSTGEQTYSLGFKPAGLIILATNLAVYDAHVAGAQAEGFSIVAVDPAGTHCVGIASEHGAGASNGHNRVSNELHVMKGDGTAALAGAITLVDDGFKIDWTTVQASPRAFNVTAFRASPRPAGPIPMFEADTTTPADGTVKFTDLSNPNGAPISAWEWDFGDGGGSTERHPTHAYSEFGEYTVQLTVTNANGSEALTRHKYINYAGGAVQWLGVYEPRTVTNDSRNRLYGDDPDHPLYGYHEHALDLAGLDIDAYPEDIEKPKSGKLRIKSDLANDRLILILPDGTFKYLSFD